MERGSFTIEAAVIVPFFLFLMITVLQIGIGFYEESVARKTLHKWNEFQAVSMFYKMQGFHELKEEVLKCE